VPDRERSNLLRKSWIYA